MQIIVKYKKLTNVSETINILSESSDHHFDNKVLATIGLLGDG